MLFFTKLTLLNLDLTLAIILISKKKLFYHLYERNPLQIETCTVKTTLHALNI
jgi:hypothetical protein